MCANCVLAYCTQILRNSMYARSYSLLTRIFGKDKTPMNYEPAIKFAKAVSLTVLVIMFLLIGTNATSSILSANFRIRIGNQIFAVGGYWFDVTTSLRLIDIAYILDGTSAQFSIRPPADNRWDFWIVRGDTFVPTGDELAEIPDRYAILGSYGFVSGYGIGSDFMQTVILGIDGIDYPAYYITINVIVDEDDIYFPIYIFADILGFRVDDILSDDYHFLLTPNLELVSVGTLSYPSDIYDEPSDDAYLPSEHMPDSINDDVSDFEIVIFCTNPGQNSALIWLLPAGLILTIIAFAILRARIRG